MYGIIGAVCSHSVPLKGTFMDMHGPEQFVYYYYLVLLKHVVKACPSIRDVYVDFACRLKVVFLVLFYLFWGPTSQKQA